MKVQVIGTTRLTGTSRKTGRPYDNTVVHVAYPRSGVAGMATEVLWLSPTEYPADSITVGGTYDLDRDQRGFVIGFAPGTGK